MALAIFQLAPQTWERTTLGEIVQRGGGSIRTGPFGSQLHASDYVPVGVPSIMPINIGDNRLVRDGIACITEADAQRLSMHIVRKGDIIYSRRGDVERRALVREEEDGWFCGTGCLKVRLGDGIVVPEFASYYLGHPEVREWIVRHAVGATMPNLNTSIMEAIPFLLPPIDEQNAIASVLGTLDDKIEQNRRTARVLERLARTIFRAWFVDFEPVKAKAAGETSFPSMPQPAFDALPTRLVDSEIGPVPEGWGVGVVGDIARLLSGYAFKSKDWVEQGIPVVKIGSVKPGIVDLSQVSYVSDEVAKTASRFRLYAGDLLVGMTGYVGEVGLVPQTINSSLLNQRVGKFVLEEQGTGRLGFVYCMTRRPEFKAAVEAKSHGTAQANVSAQGILSIQTVIPSKQVRDEFDTLCQPIIDKILACDAESRKLAEIRDLLLPKLLSGQVRVAVDADRSEIST